MTKYQQSAATSDGNAFSLLYPNVEVDKVFYAMFSYYIREYSDAQTLLQGMNIQNWMNQSGIVIGRLLEKPLKKLCSHMILLVS